MMGRYRAVVLACLLAATMGASTNRAFSQLSGFIAGSWTCTYTVGKQTATYHAVFSPVGQATIHEHDTWTGQGGGDEAFLTQDAAKNQWTMVVFENGRATLFMATGADGSHLRYRSVYPNASMTNAFDRVSPGKYTLRFTQAAGGKTTRSLDVCTKG